MNNLKKFVIITAAILAMAAVGVYLRNTGNELMIFNETNFEEKVLKSEEVVMVDFWAPWCGPCNRMTPVVEKLAADYTVGKVNIDENSTLSSTYKISAIPAVVFFKNGEEVERLVGIQTEEKLREVFEEHK